ncbi:DUF3124 domain-containing protein [Tenacibaculum sp. TC6]|uniref:DUF3124 domain-containing protein n=1 Tax=Tenacibaculum sp. TC6 TaxID=3423223 RepID=UPI003D35BB21
MKKLLYLWVFFFLVTACNTHTKNNSVAKVDWSKRMVNTPIKDSLVNGATYLSIYSQIYSQTEHKTFNLTATVSIRNTNINDTVFIHKAEYFNTQGKSIRTYFDNTIYLAPMETVEIVIKDGDREGGTGANFLFDWSVKQNANEPFFEGVMISTYGQQGLSFTTQGRKIH